MMFNQISASLYSIAKNITKIHREISTKGEKIFITTVILMTMMHLQIKLVSSNHTLPLSMDDDFYSYFIREAPLHPADYHAGTSIKDIPWLDINLLQKAAKYYQDQFLGISLSHLYSLIEVIAIKSTTSVLLSTGHFGNDTISASRLLRTIVNAREWCNSGSKIFDASSNAFKTIHSVRNRHKSGSYTFKESNIVDKINDYEKKGRHKALVEAIQADLAYVDTSDAPIHLLQWNSTTPVGQFDLGVVQFLFYCHSTMNPEAYGVINSSSSEDRLAFIHLWAVLGRLLGIQDRFNVALNLPPHRHRHFYNNIVVASLKNIDETVISLMSNTMDGWYANFLVPTVFRLKCWLFYALRSSVHGFKGQNIRRLMNLEDEVCLVYVTAAFTGLNASKTFIFFNKLIFDSWLEKELKRLGIKY